MCRLATLIFSNLGSLTNLLLEVNTPRGTLNTPPHELIGIHIRAGQPSRKISTPARDIFKPARKQLPAPPENEKSIALAFLKAA